MDNSDLKLPSELIRKIFKYLQVRDLSSASQASTQWRDIAQDLLLEKYAVFRNLFSGTNDELKASFNNPTPWKILSKYEETKIGENFELVPFHDPNPAKFVPGTEVAKNAEDFIDHVKRMHQGSGSVPFMNDIIQFLPRFSLMFLNTGSSVMVFHQMDMFGFLRNENENNGESDGDEDIGVEGTNLVPYSITYSKSDHKVYGDPNSETFVDISAYKDKMITICNDRKRLLLYQITNVDHRKRILELKPLRKIFLPLWAKKVLLYKSKVFILFTTFSLGVWKGNPDQTDLGEDEFEMLDLNLQIPDGISVEPRILRILDSILISCPVTNASYRWYHLDANSPGPLQLVTVQNLLHGRIFPRQNLSDLYAQNNAIVLHFVHQDTQESLVVGARSKGPLSRERLFDWNPDYPIAEDFDFYGNTRPAPVHLLAIPFWPAGDSKLIVGLVPKEQPSNPSCSSNNRNMLYKLVEADPTQLPFNHQAPRV